MKTDYVTQFEHILGNVAVGIVVLNAADLHVLYANNFILTLAADLLRVRQSDAESTRATTLQGRQESSLDEKQWRDHCISDLLPATIAYQVTSLLEKFAHKADQNPPDPLRYSEVPFEGFLEQRGRTYWNIQIEYHKSQTSNQSDDLSSLFLTIEDVTEQVRSRLQIAAFHTIASASTGPDSLQIVLERILQILHDMFGSQRCAIFLLEPAVPASPETEENHDDRQESPTATARVIAQRGLHSNSYHWQVPIDEHTQLSTLIREPYTHIITETAITPSLTFPYLDREGSPQRPGSVLSVPIFAPAPIDESGSSTTHTDRQSSNTGKRIFGAIEVYHIRARAFPSEEVRLLEQFARQAGLAIHNARLLDNIDLLARNAARNARQREKIMQTIPDGIVIFDPQWRIIDFNQAARDLFGWTDAILLCPIEQAFQQGAATFLTDFYRRPHLARRIEKRARQAKGNDEKIQTADGRVYHVHTTYTPIHDDYNTIFAFAVIYHDISDAVAARERIKAEVISRTAELKQRNSELQTIQQQQENLNTRMSFLLESLPVGVIMVAAEHNRITMINQQAVKLLLAMGCTIGQSRTVEAAKQQAIGLDCEQVLRSIVMYNTSNAKAPFEERPLYTALHEGKSSTTEMHTPGKDGQPIYLFISAVPLRDTNEKVHSAILVYQETTRIKTLEHAREDFFTTMAHELKTPLANIRAHLSALLAKDMTWTDEQQHAFLQTADQQVDRLVGMINHFLDASRVEAGALHLEIEPILFPELLEDLEERIQALVTSSHRRLVIHQPRTLPALRGDYELIMSVLINLLSNAFRYTPEDDEVELTVTLHKQQHKRSSYARISVTDHGPGISKEQQARLFTRFSTFAAFDTPSSEHPGQTELGRQPPTSRWSPATGLGLYISRGIVEAHGGQLELSSAPGQGATFTFTLPLYQKDCTEQTTTRAEELAGQ